jgi:hypothetical protein
MNNSSDPFGSLALWLFGSLALWLFFGSSGSSDRGGETIGTLLAVKLPKTGRYTAWITCRRGAGDYTARLIDGD